MSKGTCFRFVGLLYLLVATVSHGQQLEVSGASTPGGQVVVEITGEVGQPATLIYGSGFLNPGIPALGGQTFYIDLAQNWFLLPLGNIPASGKLSFPAPIPNDPLYVGEQVHMQAGIGTTLTNPMTLWLHEIALTAALEIPHLKLGTELHTADLNNDGLGDLIMSSNGSDGTGAVFVAFGPNEQPALMLTDPTPQTGAIGGAVFGAALAAADIIGSSDIDIVVSAPHAGLTSADNSGEVWIFQGPDFSSHVQIPGPDGPETGFGGGVAAGDFDGDGRADLAVGAAGTVVDGFPLAGKIHVYQGGTLNLMTTITEQQPEEEALFGFRLQSDGDFNNDGKDELLVGSPAASPFGVDKAGEAWLYYGPFDGVPTRYFDPHPSGTSAFGCAIRVADVVGDSRPDVIIGNPGGLATPDTNPTAIALSGEVEVYDGGDPLSMILLEDPTPEFFQHYGMEVGAADLDGDGKKELIVGAFLADIGGAVDTGEVYIYSGENLGVRAQLTAPSPVDSSTFGLFLSRVDLDGDGKDELAVTSPGETVGSAQDAGKVYIFKY